MSNKTVVITGASAGIGAGIARRLAADGYTLVLTARRQTELERLADELNAGGARTIAVAADATSRTDLQMVATTAIDTLGGFDVWINNAGQGMTRTVLELTDIDVDEMMSINLKSALHGMQIATGHFMSKGSDATGHIINVSSFLARVPLATHRAAYNAAKAGLNALTANLRMDLRKTHPNVHVTLVMPGMVATEFGMNAVYSPPGTTVYSGPFVQSVEDVADVFARVIEHPVAEVYTSPRSSGMVRDYFADVEAFEARGIVWGSAPAGR
jgi:short-subunit dehydrogenase